MFISLLLASSASLALGGSPQDLSIALAGPEGTVLLLSRVGDRVFAKPCEELSVLDQPEDCILHPGSSALSFPISELGDHTLKSVLHPPDPAMPESPVEQRALKEKIEGFLKFYCYSLQADTTCNEEVGGKYLPLLKALTTKLNEHDALVSRANRAAATVTEHKVPMLHYVASEISEKTLAQLLQGPNRPLISFRNFVTIPAGSVALGSASHNRAHQANEAEISVSITRAFQLQTSPVTQLEWFSVMGTNPSHFANQKYCPEAGASLELNGQFICSELPVESVSWQDVQNFLYQVNLQDSEFTYRLPTEAEWEYAARAGSEADYFFGDDPNQLGDYAWYAKNAGAQPHAVCTARVKTNSWGLCDVHGNVWQWVSDWYAIARSGGADPTGPAQGTDRVFRGGAWNGDAALLRSASRDRGTFHTQDFTDYRASFLGFRLAREPRVRR